ncbi:MAG: CBS domain-containing protein [Piscinibacter sp.]|nr:CBS domain-containing protein [Piscinibacter sp.]
MSATPPANPPATTPPLRGDDPHQALIAVPLRDLLTRPPVQMAPTATIREAAMRMRDENVTSVLLVEDGRLAGIVTDRDLRNRVVAAGVSGERPVAEVATRAPHSVELSATAFDALLLMARHDVHHVPVLDGTRVAGLVSATDLAERQSASAVVLAGEIHAQDDLAGLQRASARIRQLQRMLAAADATAYATGHIVTAITDALTKRLIHLAERRLGPPPVAYAWVAAGSQARSEQTARSDQDNCMVLADDFDAARDTAYFDALAREVCSGLDACGYVFCPGEMMAMTPRWRQTRRQWMATLRHWVEEPDPTALMLTCVFFDMRAVHGAAALVEEVCADALSRTRGHGIFLAHMARNALSRRPPLGLFGGISAPRSGEHRGTVDLKMLGVVPIVDLARVYALAGGHTPVNTHDRLAQAARSGEVSEQGAHDLRDALEYLAALRIQHQARQLDAGRPVDNLLVLHELSNFERTQLRDAFRVVQGLQDVLAARYRL